ncbi:aspartate aminotransferase family protein, partial [Streptomyces sp. ZEA17I]
MERAQGLPPARLPLERGGTGDLLAGGADGPGRVRALTSVVLDTLETAARVRGGPLP